jgi:hypothetical protein
MPLLHLDMIGAPAQTQHDKRINRIARYERSIIAGRENTTASLRVRAGSAGATAVAVSLAMWGSTVQSGPVRRSEGDPDIEATGTGDRALISARPGS